MYGRPRLVKLRALLMERKEIAAMYPDFGSGMPAVPDGIRWRPPRSAERTRSALTSTGFGRHGLTCLAINVAYCLSNLWGVDFSFAASFAFRRFSRWSSCRVGGVAGLVLAVLSQERPHDASRLVGQRDRCDVGIAPVEQLGEPADLIGFALGAVDH